MACSGLLSQSQTFNFPVPDGWEGEEIPFPIEFAPNIPYSGTEYVRFAPGWGDPESEEHWSYCFMWWIDNNAEINTESLNTHIQEYYAGLVGRNVISRQIDSRLVIPTMSKFVQEKPGLFSGTVSMLDYHTNRPIVLNITVDVRTCEQQGKLAAFFAVSPLPGTNRIWELLRKVMDGFRCVQ